MLGGSKVEIAQFFYNKVEEIKEKHHNLYSYFSR